MRSIVSLERFLYEENVNFLKKASQTHRCVSVINYSRTIHNVLLLTPALSIAAANQ